MNTLRNWIESLSLTSGAILVAVCSVVLVALWSRSHSGFSAWVAAFAFPLLISCFLYWLPVCLGAPADEYPAWALLFIPLWFLAGAIPSAVAVFVARRFFATNRNA